MNVLNRFKKSEVETEDFFHVGPAPAPRIWKFKVLEGKRSNKIVSFTTDLCKAAVNKIKDFAVGMWHNKQGVVILTLAVSGACYHIEEIPFWIWLPTWVEGPMVVPVVSVLLVLGLLKWAKRSEKKRFAST